MKVGVAVGRAGVEVFVGVDVGPPALQLPRRKEPMRVCQNQLKLLLYSCVYQKVQSSAGSMLIAV